MFLHCKAYAAVGKILTSHTLVVYAAFNVFIKKLVFMFFYSKIYIFNNYDGVWSTTLVDRRPHNFCTLLGCTLAAPP